jgi:hypothetical protein
VRRMIIVQFHIQWRALEFSGSDIRKLGIICIVGELFCY